MDASTFILTASHGDVDAAREALRANPALASARNDSGISVIACVVYAGRSDLAREIAATRSDLDLFEASCLGDMERVATILESEPEIIDHVAPDGFSAIALAAYFGHFELLHDLIVRGADLEAPARNAMQVRPLHSAVAHADPSRATELARLLLESGANANAQQAGGFAPLHEALLNNNIELIELLLSFGANPHLSNDEGDSPFQLAQARGLDSIAALLSTSTFAVTSAVTPGGTPRNPPRPAARTFGANARR